MQKWMNVCVFVSADNLSTHTPKSSTRRTETNKKKNHNPAEEIKIAYINTRILWFGCFHLSHTKHQHFDEWFRIHALDYIKDLLALVESLAASIKSSFMLQVRWLTRLIKHLCLPYIFQWIDEIRNIFVQF